MCALSLELAAARAMFDEDHVILKYGDVGDDNKRIIGRTDQREVVIISLLTAVDCTCTAASQCQI